MRVALSLHAPSQELRAKIVPAAKQWPLHELIEALDDHLNSVSRHSGSHDGLMIASHSHLRARPRGGSSGSRPALDLLAPHTVGLTAHKIFL